MSKWTLEKILACEEIKAGCWFSRSALEPELILSKTDSGFWFWDRTHGEVNGFHGTQEWREFKFYNGSGTEILPPKDKKKIKIDVWVNVYGDGSFYAHTTKESADNKEYKHRTACEYFEREIEVIDDE